MDALTRHRTARRRSSTGALPTKDVTDLRWRHAIASDALDAKLFAGLEQHLNGRDDLRASALRMSLLERMVTEGHDLAPDMAAEMHLSDASSLGERRLRARHATCLARLTNDPSRRAKLLHAAAMHRHAGSTRAAMALLDEAHTVRVELLVDAAWTSCRPGVCLFKQRKDACSMSGKPLAFPTGFGRTLHRP